MKLVLGSADTTLDVSTGALVVQVSLDSIYAGNKPQISLLNGATHYDTIYGNSAAKIAAPARPYLLRTRMIGAQTIQDSISVRRGFTDTVKILLGREVVCLAS